MIFQNPAVLFLSQNTPICPGTSITGSLASVLMVSIPRCTSVFPGAFRHLCMTMKICLFTHQSERYFLRWKHLLFSHISVSLPGNRVSHLYQLPVITKMKCKPEECFILTEHKGVSVSRSLAIFGSEKVGKFEECSKIRINQKFGKCQNFLGSDFNIRISIFNSWERSF